MCKDEANSMFDSTHLCEMHVPWLVHSPTEVLETGLEFYAHAFLNFLSYKFEYICIRCRISADEEWKPVWKRLLVPAWTVHRIWEGFWNGGNEWMEGRGGWGLNTNSSLSLSDVQTLCNLHIRSGFWTHSKRNFWQNIRNLPFK